MADINSNYDTSKSTTKFNKDENFNDCASVSTVSSISSYRAKIREEGSSDSESENFDDCVSVTSTIGEVLNKEDLNGSGENKLQDLDLTVGSEDLDSSVDTLYDDESEKMQALERKIISMEKYIKELETSVHLQRTQNGVLQNREMLTLRSQLKEQNAKTQNLEKENNQLRQGLAALKKSVSQAIIDSLESANRELKNEVQGKEKELFEARSDLCGMKAQGLRDVQEIAYLKALLDCPTESSKVLEIQSLQCPPPGFGIKKEPPSPPHLTEKTAAGTVLLHAAGDSTPQKSPEEEECEAGKFKIRPCTFYLTDTCSKGERCQFAHIPLQKLYYKTTMCKHFPNCTNGDNCQYAHSNDELRLLNFRPRIGLIRKLATR